MMVRIEHIDLVGRVVQVAVGGHDSPDRVREFALKCSTIGFAVAVRLDASCRYGEWASLVDTHGPVRLTDELPEERENDPIQFYEDTTADKSVIYRISCSDLLPSVHSIAEFVQLCGYSLALDHTTMYRLRLCVYELATNSVEHATFLNDKAKAKVEITVRPKTLKITYADNSQAFDPSEDQVFDMDTKLERQDKRGFGLYLLRRIARTMKFKRKNGWNCTTFTIDRGTVRTPQPTGGK